MFDQKKFNKFVLENVLTYHENPIKLKSQKFSNYYFNYRKVSNNKSLLDELVNYIIEFTEENKLNSDCFVGVPESATKIGLFTQYKWCERKRIENCELPMIRKIPRDHGAIEDKYFVGAPRGNIIIIEDVTTTGSSLLKTIDIVKRYSKSNIIGVYSLTDRMESTTKLKFLKSLNGVKYYALSTWDPSSETYK